MRGLRDTLDRLAGRRVEALEIAGDVVGGVSVFLLLILMCFGTLAL